MASIDRIKEILQCDNSTNNAIQFVDDKIIITLTKDNSWEKVDAEVPLNGGPYAATVRLGTFFGTFETQVSRCLYENGSTTGESSKDYDSGVAISREDDYLPPSRNMRREEILDHGYASSTAPSLGEQSADVSVRVAEPEKDYQQYYKNLNTNMETLRKKRSASMDCLSQRDPVYLPSEKSLMLKRTIDAAPTGGMLNHWFEDGVDAARKSRPYLKGDNKPIGRYDTLSSAWTGRMSKVSAGDYLKSGRYSSQISLSSKTKHNNNKPFSYHRSNKESFEKGYDLFYPMPLESQVKVEPPAKKDKCTIV